MFSAVVPMTTKHLLGNSILGSILWHRIVKYFSYSKAPREISSRWYNPEWGLCCVENTLAA